MCSEATNEGRHAVNKFRRTVTMKIIVDSKGCSIAVEHEREVEDSQLQEGR